MAEEENEATSEEKSGGKPWLLILLAAVVALLLGAGGTFFLLGNKQEPAEAAQAKASEEPPVAPDLEFGERVFKMDPFIVNVTGEGYPRYLKMQIAFEMSSPEARQEAESRVSQIRDTTILLLSSKRLSDINDFEGKALLKDDLRDRVNALLKSGRVESVLFTEFVVQ